eukprot:gb/GFBE01063086.1/.p1 GENE.gb/GFBE01063086.1/~~gb/GFBE01063086.1/.p1  ORF type:complete len:334 (+),score=61.30 gb/GFBE01063086.1/:1-1002(+)
MTGHVAGAEAAVWEVVGGRDKGGVLVREGSQLSSAQCTERLSTGSVVRQIELMGDRLHFQRLSGTGPETGWVSIRLKDKELLIPAKTTQPASVTPEAKTSPSAQSRKVRILALHGGGSNSNVTKFQTLPLQKLTKDFAEWHFLNGSRPWTHDKPDEMLTAIAKGMPFFGWYGVDWDDQSERPYQEKLFDPSVNFTYTKVEEAVDRVLEHLKTDGPFDVLLGFSQGCIVTNLITGILASRGQEIPWKLSVLFNGMKVRDNRYRQLFDDKIRHPVIMVFGKQDQFYDYGQTQIGMYEDPIVLEHDEGHKFPTAKPQAAEIYEAVTQEILKRCRTE